MLLSVSRGSDKHIIVFASPKVLQIHRKSQFEEFFLHFNDHKRVMGIRRPHVADISISKATFFNMKAVAFTLSLL